MAVDRQDDHVTEVAATLAALDRGHDMLLETRRRDGSWVATPVNPVVDDGRVLFRTWATSGKAKRLRNFSAVQFAPSNARGRPKGRSLRGTATLLSGDAADQAAKRINRKFPLLQGVGVRLVHRLRHQHTQHYEITDPHV